jgi:protein-S-isoprenylcysteine O-methyltransferase
VEWFFFPIPGILLCVVGLGVLAQHHARQSFTHEAQESKRDVHTLNTTGVFQYLRHPGYFGWFWYTVGTQVLLANPFCLPAFAVVSFMFFRDRIEYEERKLIQFFGQEYEDFRKKTPVLIPGIN